MPIALLIVFLIPSSMILEATVTGTQVELCENTLKGHYTLKGDDRCPDGNWSNIIKAPK